jgi:hypothetical protein
MGFSSRARLDVQKYVETEEQKVKQQQQKKVDADKAEVNQKVSRFWSQPVQVLKTLHDLNPEGAIDKYCGLTRTTEARTHERQSTTFDEYIHKLAESGTVLSDDAQQRLVIYAIAQVFADLTLQENWHKAFHRLQELHAFKEGDVVVTEKPAAPKKQAEELIDLERIDSSTRSGRKAEKRAVEKMMFNDTLPIYKEFCEFLVKTYDRYLTKAELSWLSVKWRRDVLR